MNMYSNDYLKNQIATASKEQLLIMFYDGAIRFTLQAKQAMERKDIEGRNYAVNKATAIITELAATLDHDIGGKIAEDLDSLYAYMLKELNTVCIKNDQNSLDAIVKILNDLRKTWVQAIDIVKQERYAQSTPAKVQQHQPHRPFSVAL